MQFFQFRFHRWSTFYMFLPYIQIKTIFMAIFSRAISVKWSKMAIIATIEWAQYGQKYGLYWCLWKEYEKCGSPVKTELKKLRWVKSYGQIKIDSENMAVSFVFWPHFSQNLKRKVATFLMLHFFTSLSVWVQNGQHNGIKVRKIWFSNKMEIQDTLLERFIFLGLIFCENFSFTLN